jgi:hypothetical protein
MTDNKKDWIGGRQPFYNVNKITGINVWDYPTVDAADD